MSLGPWQLLLILAIVILLFGAGRIPRLMGDLAKGIRSFKAGMKEESQAEHEEPAQARQIEMDAGGKATTASTTTGTASTAASAAPPPHRDETARP